MADDDDIGLTDAYALSSNDDRRALYRSWASTYDPEFIAVRGYIYHLGVADLYVAEQTDLDAPVLDVGCGTGVAGVALVERSVSTVDGIDLSPEMLEQAQAKDVYRSLAEADLLQPLTFEDGAYGGVVCVGVFTHGHLGPEPLPELARVVRPGGLLALGINEKHFHAAGFEAALEDLRSSGLVDSVRLETIRMYERADDDRADDAALVALLRRPD